MVRAIYTSIPVPVFLPSRCSFTQLPAQQIAFDRVEMCEDEYAIQMVNFVLKSFGGNAVQCHFKCTSIFVVAHAPEPVPGV